MNVWDYPVSFNWNIQWYKWKQHPTYGVKTWNKWFVESQDYLPRYLWVVGAKRRKWYTTYGKQRKQNFCKFALSVTYLMSLSNIGWCLLENSYNSSISKLNEIKPSIKLKIENQKKIDNNNRLTSGKDNKANNPHIHGSGTSNSGGKLTLNNRKHYQGCKTC